MSELFGAGENIGRLLLGELEHFLADPEGAIRSIFKEPGGYRHQVIVRADVPYARYMEYGTVYNAAHPFLRPAVRRAKRSLPRKAKARLRKWN